MCCARKYTYGDCLRHTTNEWNPEEVEKAKQFKAHLSDCPTCQRILKTMDGWVVEEDAKLVERTMRLPFPILQPELEVAIRQGDAAVASTIVERLIQEAKKGNKRALPILRMAAEQGPGFSQNRAQTYLQTITDRVEQ